MEWEKGGGATIVYNILWPAKFRNAWRNIPYLLVHEIIWMTKNVHHLNIGQIYYSDTARTLHSQSMK